jgi:hypothetical protein
MYSTNTHTHTHTHTHRSVGKKFVYRPKKRADFDVDREILAEYRAQVQGKKNINTKK